MWSTVRRLFAMLDMAERRQLRWLLVLIVCTALLEATGVASVVPVVALVTDPELAERNGFLRGLGAFLGMAEVRSLQIVVAATSLGLVLTSGMISTLTVWKMHRFVRQVQHGISCRLLRSYLAMPYPFFADRNGSDLAKNIVQEVQVTVGSFLLPCLQMAARAIVLCFVGGLLLVAEPVVTAIAAGVFGGAYLGVYLVTRGRIRRHGGRRHKNNAQRYHLMGEIFGGIKEIKVMELEEPYLTRFASASAKMVRAEASGQIITHVPKYAIEMLAFGGLVGFLLLLLLGREDHGEVFSLVALFALAGTRILPAMQQIFWAVSIMGMGRASADHLCDDYESTSAAADGAGGPAGAAIESVDIALEGVGFAYHQDGSDVLSGIDLHIPEGQSVALVGRTGCGKTTMLDIMLGLLRPVSGQLRIGGRVLDRDLMPAWRARVGYVPQHIFLADASIADNVTFGVPGDEIDRSAFDEAVSAACLDEFVAGLPAGYETVVGERGVRLSGGQRQRIGIARALYRRPKVLVLDEATSALDGDMQGRIIRRAASTVGGRTVIQVAHRLESLKDCDRIIYLEGGRIVAEGTYEHLLAEVPSFREMAAAADAPTT